MNNNKLAWVGLNTALTRVENAIACLGGIPDLGDGDVVNPDSLDSFLGLIELDLIRVRHALVNRISQVEKDIKNELQGV